MSLNILDNKGTPLANQTFTWKDMVQNPISKLDDDAFTRVRIILLNGIEQQSSRFQHMYSLMNEDLRKTLAMIRRVEQHQQTLVNWLLSPDHSPLELTIGYEQVAIEVTASAAQHEPDPYLAQVYRFGMLEDFDHLYRYSALLDRLEGKDANTLLQCYTDILQGRPTTVEHRSPEDDLRTPYSCSDAQPISKLNALTIYAGEYQTLNYYMTIGPTFADPLARQLYAEIASIEEQHVTQYGSLISPQETWLEKWLLHETNEVYNYYSCMKSEKNDRIKAIWERFLDYELGHLHTVIKLFEQIEQRDAADVIPATLPDPIDYESHREFVRNTLLQETDLRAKGTQFVGKDEESQATLQYRDHLNSEGCPSQMVAAGYQWAPGTEICKKMPSAA